MRLGPGSDLKKELDAYAQTKKITAGWVVTCVGSLSQANLRAANQPAGTLISGPFEIVSLVGTASKNGCHLHICVSNAQGACTGGHLLNDTLVYTTAEIIIGESTDLVFSREPDAETGWNELVINQKRK